MCEVPSIPRCAGRLLTDLSSDACTAATCPCWRVTPNQACARYGAPYRLEVLYSPVMPKTYWNINATCELSMHPWGSAALAGMPQCL